MDFDEAERRKVRAACGAFLMVAFADGKFDRSEEARLLAGLANSTPFDKFPSPVFEGEYNGLNAAIQSDYRAAADTVLDDIAWAREVGGMDDIIMMAARAAIVADERVEAQEEAAIRQIAEALGREAGEI